MIYEVRAILFFAEPDEARDFLHDCENALPKAIVIKPGQPDQQCSFADLIACNHDDTPPRPCVLIEHRDNCPG